MSLKLKPNEVCPYKNCKYQKDPSYYGVCQGTNPNRNNFFECEFIVDGKIIDDPIQNINNKTGSMVLLSENEVI